VSASATVTTIQRLQGGERAELIAFLRGREDTTVFHSPEWHDVIRATYGHSSDYWLARSDEGIAGVFPVVVVRAPLLGAKMVAMAYQMDSGVPLVQSSEVGAALVERATAEAKRAGVRYIEIRSLSAAPQLETLGFRSVASGLVTTVVPLAGIELSRIRRNHRRSVRASEDGGLIIEESRSQEDLKRFCDLYLREGRALGAPQAGWRFFRNLHTHAPSLYRLYVARLGDRFVGGLVTVGDDRVTYARHAAYSSREALEAHAGAALYWHAISSAAAAGGRFFNCGISWERDSGLIHWKEGWSGQSCAVHLYVMAIRGQPPKPGDYLGGFQRAKAVWRKLPLPLAEAGGQLVTSWVC
jgi:hypothetical protein